MVKLGQLQLVVVMLFPIRNAPGGAPLFLELQASDAAVSWQWPGRQALKLFSTSFLNPTFKSKSEFCIGSGEEKKKNT